MTEDPLVAVLLKKEEVEGENRALLAKLIIPFAAVEPESGQVYFTEAGDKLITRHKILVFLLCRLALVSLKPDATIKPAVTPKDIEEATRIAGGTVRPKLKELTDEKIVFRSGEGYQVTGANLKRAHKELERVLPQDA
jgi:hypothetical protein